MSTASILVIALLIDALFGEPEWIWRKRPHPAVLMGRVIAAADARFNTGARRKLSGVCVVAALVVLMAILGALVSAFGWIPQVIIVAILLAHRSLVDHVRAVADALRVSVEDGRGKVARIVSRDTASMDTSGVSRSAIESAAENLSDGVIAPAFWFLVGGLPGLLIYKIVNTADSMIGYRTPRHKDFGWAAARLDDVLNWVPARLTAALIAGTHHRLGDWKNIIADASKHRSPNAGWPESAMARALGVAIAGPRTYDGILQDFPFVNPQGRHVLGANDIDAACKSLWITWAAFLAGCVLLSLF